MKTIHKYAPLLLIIVFGLCGGTLVGLFFGLTRDLPQIQELKSFVPSAITRIHANDNVILSELYSEKRKPIPLRDIPAYLKGAVIATEDRTFYTHSGIHLKGIMRALIRDIQARKFVEGASTITQQLAKTLFLTSSKTITRKLKEAILAFQIERRYTKDEILELYLNQIYLGSGAYGVESAAENYFGKPAKSLNLPECALIAAMPKAPSRFSPLVNLELAERRRNIVLKQMLQTGIITEQEYQDAIHSEISITDSRNNATKAPYFIQFLKRDLENTLGPTQLYKGGLDVYTTVNYQWQLAAENAVQTGLKKLSDRMRDNNAPVTSLQAALVALEVKTGAILCMVGGKDYTSSSYNRVTMAKRQPGSAFKPIIYAFALENGFSQNQLILDGPVAFENSASGETWEPKNFSRTYAGEITLRKALALSKNIPAVRLTQIMGAASVAEFANSMGITSRLTADLSIALGTSEITLLDLTAAYSAFPNRGHLLKPYGILEIVSSKGHVVWRPAPEKRILMSEASAAIMVDMLSAVIQEGTGRGARSLHRPLAGKTGTTDDFKDALFIGFSPDLVTGVWVGQDDGLPLGQGETGATAALPIWKAFMADVLQDQPYRHFGIPDNVQQVRVDPGSGELTDADNPDGVTILIRR